MVYNRGKLRILQINKAKRTGAMYPLLGAGDGRDPGGGFFMSKNGKERKLKRAVIKEELVALTGQWQEAVILQQLLHWTQTINQSDELIRQQVAAFKQMGMEKEADEISSLIRDGWFYKSAEELADELMCMKKTQVNNYLNRLEEKKFFKSVPFSPTKRTRYIKVNVRYIRDELAKLGYTLEGFVWDDEVKMPETQELSQTGFRKCEKPTSDSENPSDKAKPDSGNAKLSQSENRKYTENTETETTSVLSVLSVVQRLFFDYIGIEITFKEAEQVVLTAFDTGKDVEEAIKETLRYFELTGKQMMKPVGSVIYGMTNGWNLEKLEKEKDKTEKIAQYGQRMKQGKTEQKTKHRLARKKSEKIPEMLRIQLENQQQQESIDPEEQERKIAELRAKIEQVNEKHKLKTPVI